MKRQRVTPPRKPMAGSATRRRPKDLGVIEISSSSDSEDGLSLASRKSKVPRTFLEVEAGLASISRTLASLSSKYGVSVDPAIEAGEPSNRKRARYTTTLEQGDSAEADQESDWRGRGKRQRKGKEKEREKRDGKGKGKRRAASEDDSDDDSDDCLPHSRPSLRRNWDCDLNELNIEQLEAIVVAAKTDRAATLGDLNTAVQPHADAAPGRELPAVTIADQDRATDFPFVVEPDGLQAEPTRTPQVAYEDDQVLEEMEERAVMQIMDIVPDANRDHVVVMVCGFLPTYGPRHIVDFVVQQLLEAPPYETKADDPPLADVAEDVTMEEVAEDGTAEDELRDCGCCYNQLLAADMVVCDHGHTLCLNCVQRHAEHQLGVQKSTIACIDVSGCDAVFGAQSLRRLLPENLFTLYERVVQQNELKEANIDGLESCPFCDWACIMETPKELNPEMVCGNQEKCGAVSCRLCRSKQHPSQTCTQAQGSARGNGRVALEEVMSEAMKRHCPKCQTAFIKEDGCNKMTCPNPACLVLSCYVCRKEIAGYDHFHVNPNEPTRVVCPLWDAYDVEHRHEMDVGEALAQYNRVYIR